MGAPALVLGSGSASRKALLDRLGLRYEVVPPSGVDEEAAKALEPDPARLAARLAREKCLYVAALRPGAVVIGSDQVGVIEDPAAPEIVEKPGTVERAVAQLLRQSGRTTAFHTAFAVRDGRTGALHEGAAVGRVRFRKLTEGTVRTYIERERPLACAGSFKLEGLGVALFEAIEADDPTGIIGLPLLRLIPVLERCGVAIL